jgi:rRNA-processing protein FCF1
MNVVIAKVVIHELKTLLETIRRHTDVQAREAAAIAQGALSRLHRLKAQATALHQLTKVKSAPKARGKAQAGASI